MILNDMTTLEVEVRQDATCRWQPFTWEVSYTGVQYAAVWGHRFARTLVDGKQVGECGLGGLVDLVNHAIDAHGGLRRGRPKARQARQRVNLMVHPVDLGRIDAECASLGITRAEFYRRAVDAYLRRDS